MNALLDRAVARLSATAAVVRRHRLAFVVPAYAALHAVCYALAFLLRFEFDPGPTRFLILWGTIPVALLAHLVAELVTREWWRTYRYSSLIDVVQAAVGGLFAAGLLFLVNVLRAAPMWIPNSIILIDLALSVLATCLLRGGLRTGFEWLRGAPTRRSRQRAIVFGDEAAGIAMLKAMQTGNREYRVVGFMSDDPRRDFRLVSGLPVLPGSRGVKRIARRLRARHLLIPASLNGRRLRELVKSSADAGIRTHVIPSAEQLLEGRFKVSVRDVTIADLLRREPARLDRKRVEGCLAGKRVLVTGGAGSIGSELCRQILALRPERLIVLDQSEFGVFEMQQELAARGDGGSALAFVVADVVDRTATGRVFAEHRPDIVFHAAAYKHVPLLEDLPHEAIRNNVLGTKTVVDLAVEHGAGRFVLISTDKAVRPSSVMGSTKLVAEKYVQSASASSRTDCVTVRFGNVLNSAGSVVPTFRKQIEAGGPITVTHPDIERFFMTIPEAVQLVLQAGAIGRSGDVMILEMGEPVKIVDLARDMIELSGLRCPDDIDIVFTGLRPGEKLYEELFYETGNGVRKVHEKIYCSTPSPPTSGEIRHDIERLERSLGVDRERALATLRAIAGRYAGDASRNADPLRLAVPQPLGPPALRELARAA